MFIYDEALPDMAAKSEMASIFQRIYFEDLWEIRSLLLADDEVVSLIREDIFSIWAGSDDCMRPSAQPVPKSTWAKDIQLFVSTFIEPNDSKRRKRDTTNPVRATDGAWVWCLTHWLIKHELIHRFVFAKKQGHVGPVPDIAKRWNSDFVDHLRSKIVFDPEFYGVDQFSEDLKKLQRRFSMDLVPLLVDQQFSFTTFVDCAVARGFRFGMAAAKTYALRNTAAPIPMQQPVINNPLPAAVDTSSTQHAADFSKMMAMVQDLVQTQKALIDENQQLRSGVSGGSVMSHISGSVSRQGD